MSVCLTTTLLQNMASHNIDIISPRMVATVEMNAGRGVVHTISCFAFVIVSVFEWSR